MVVELTPDVFLNWTVVRGSTPAIGTLAVGPFIDAVPPYSVSTLDPIDTHNGSYTYRHTDVAERGRGPVPSFVRAYNGVDTRISSLGPGWTHNYATRLYSPDDPSRPTDLVLERPDGRSDRYQSNTTNTSYAPPQGVSGQLVKNADGSYKLTEADQSSWNFDAAGKLTQLTD